MIFDCSEELGLSKSTYRCSFMYPESVFEEIRYKKSDMKLKHFRVILESKPSFQYCFS